MVLARALDTVGDRWSLLIVRWSTTLMVSGRDADSFQPRWLAVPLPALLSGRTANPQAELGIEVPGFFMTLRIDEGGPHVSVLPERRPDTILEAEREVVLGLAAGAISIDEALSGASVHGDRCALATVLPGAQT